MSYTRDSSQDLVWNSNTNVYEHTSSSSNTFSALKDNEGKTIVSNNKVLCLKIPSEYTRVDYIASTGTQYIDTGIVPTSDDLIYEWEGRDDEPSNNNTSLFGSEWAIDGNLSNRVFSGVLYSNKTYRSCWIGTSTGMNIGYVSNDDLFHKWSLTINSDHTLYLTKDGTKLTTYNWTGSINKYNTIAIFCNHTTNSFSQRTKVAYKYFKIKNNGAVVFWGIPVKRNTDNVLGMYDLISKTFFTNSGTGNFIAPDKLIFDENSLNVIQKCTYIVTGNGEGVVANANGYYGRVGFVFPVVQNGVQYNIEFDATAIDGYKRIYFHDAALNQGDGWDPVYGNVSISAGEHFTKTITSTSDVLFIGIYVSAGMVDGTIIMKNVTVTPITQ